MSEYAAVPVEEVKLGDVIARLHYHWRIIDIESWTATGMVGTRYPDGTATAFRLTVQRLGFGDDVQRLAPYFEGEKIAHVREATVAEIAAGFVAYGRRPTEPCERGTTGCSVRHLGDSPCATW